MKRLRYEDSNIDHIDRKLIDALIENSRTSNAELARMVGLSAPSVGERIKRLEEANIIEGYTANVNPTAIGLPVSVWLRIRPIPGELHTVAQILRDTHEIVECDRITGDDCYLARAHVQSVTHLEKLIDKLATYAMTNTSVIQSSPVEKRSPLFPTID